MTREEMLEKLKHIKTGAELTWLSSEYALECQYVTKEGTAYEWIGMYDWPAAMITDIPVDKLEVIKNKVKSGSLTEDDLTETGLELLWRSYSAYDHEVANTDINTFFDNIVEIEVPVDGWIYALINYRSEDEPTMFFRTYDAFLDAFSDSIGVETRWEEMDDEELADWLQRLKMGYKDVYLMPYSIEDEYPA